MRPLRGLVLSFTAMVALSGCLGDDGFGVTNVNDPTEVPLDAPSAIGKGGERLTVRVVLAGANTTPSARTPVLVYHIPDPAHSKSPPELLKVNATFAGRTDDKGEIVVRVVMGAHYSIFAFDPNHTTEVHHRLKITPGVLSGTRTIPLFPREGEFRFSGVIPLTVDNVGIPFYSKGVGTSYPAFFPQPLKFSNDPNYDKALHRRVLSLRGSISIDTPTPGVPDVGGRIRFTDSYVLDSYRGGIYFPPAPSKTWRLSAEDFRYGVDLPKSNPRIGPLLWDPQPNPAGLPYEIRLQVVFSTDEIGRNHAYQYNYEVTPGIGPLVGLAALGVLALGLRRRN